MSGLMDDFPTQVDTPRKRLTTFCKAARENSGRFLPRPLVRALLNNFRWRGGIGLSASGHARIVTVTSIGPVMRKVLLFLVAALALALGPASASAADNEKAAKSQVEFGIAVAQKNLWKEALYRWQKAVELDPGYAAAWNNLAIAWEHEGNFEEARKAYEKALSLDPKNLFIKQNYELFKEINDRANRKPAR